MDYPKEILVKNYFEIHNYYSNIYGLDKTIILMQVGSFHEAYSIYPDGDGLDLLKLSQELDIICTMKNNKLPLSKNNPKMLGFPIYTTHNYIDKLIDINYTVILIDQVSQPPNPIRKVVGIYSPATYIEKNTSSINYLVSIVIDKIKNNLCIGLCAYDLSTGEGAVYETYSTSQDKFLGLDNSIRFLDKYPPREIILQNNLEENLSTDFNEILNYLNIDQNSKNIYTVKIINHKKINWQIELINKVYKNSLENLNLEFYNWGRLSLVILLDYVISHQFNLVNNLKEPLIFNNEEHLYLGNRALDQLSISNLFNIINNTKTILGKKYLNNQLKLPLNNSRIDELNLRYNLIKYIIDNKHYQFIVNYLEDITNLDKLIRKLEINIINPCEIYNLYLSFYQIDKLNKYFEKNNLLELFSINEKLIKNIEKILEWINKKFKLEKLCNINFNNFTETDFSFYQNNIHLNIDELQNKIDITQNFMSYLIQELEKFINEKK